MKKQLLAIAMGAVTVAPMTAMAETDVYGRFDVTLQHSYQSVNIPGSQWNVRSNDSRIGVRGLEELNADLSAIYQLEMGFNLVGDKTDEDEGSVVPGFTLRNTYVGLKGDSWGKFFVGYYDSIVKQAAFSVDQFNHTVADIGTFLITQQRYSNTLNYHSPQIGPGIQVKAQIIPGEGAKVVDGNANDPANGVFGGWGLSVGMEAGYMYGAIAYQSVLRDMDDVSVLPSHISFSPSPQPGVARLNALRVSGGLSGDLFAVGFLWEKVEVEDAEKVYGANNDESRSGWVISGRFNPTESLALKIQHGTSDEAMLSGRIDNSVGGDDFSIVQTTVGADYWLAKQTKVYAFYSMQHVETDRNADVETNVIAIGLQHSF